MKKTILILFCLILSVLFVSCSEAKTAEEAYADIITEYTELLMRAQNGGSMPERSDDEIKNAILSAVLDCKDPSQMGYATKDINSDGVEELFLTSKSYDFYALFTLDSGKPSLLKTFDGGRGAIDFDGVVYSWSYSEAEDSYYNRYYLSENGLEGFEVWRTPSADGKYDYFSYFYGEKKILTENEYNYHINSYNKFSRSSMKDQTRIAGLRVHLPLAEEVESSAPVADISSYEGILELYRTVVSCMKDYSNADYMAGAYDEKLTFADDESYELYNRLLDACRHQRRRYSYSSTEYMPNADNAYGYTIKDIGGDSAEELILLTDKYTISAVFTMKNGAPALIYDSHFGGVTIGSGGEIFVSIYYDDRHMEYRGYKINGNNELELTDFAGWIYSGETHYYALADGKIIESKEKYKISADRIHELEESAPHPLREYDFMPLYEIEKIDASYENKEFSYYGSFFDENLIDFSNITDDSFDFTFKYVYSYLADPNDTAFTTYETEISAKATWDGKVYAFDNGTVSGRIHFGVGIIWIDIIESEDENIECSPKFLKLIEK